jgi:hypothetical protein
MDYWVPLGIVWSGCVWRDLGTRWWPDRPLRQALLGLVLGVCLGGLTFGHPRQLASELASSRVDELVPVMDYLQKNLPAGEFVFNSSWADFVRMFAFDPAHRYVSGLNPIFLLSHDRPLGELYDRIRAGQVEVPSVPIRARFHARYAVVSGDHSRLLVRALADPLLELVMVSAHEERYLFRLRTELSTDLELEGAWFARSLLSGGGAPAAPPGPLAFRAVEKGAFVELLLPVPEPGRYELSLRATSSPASSWAVLVDGAELGSLAAPRLTPHLKQGSARLRVELRSEPTCVATLAVASVRLRLQH